MDKWLTFDGALWFLTPFNQAEYRTGVKRIVQMSDFSTSDLLATDWTTDPIPRLENSNLQEEREEILFEDFDYAIVRYKWGADGGEDLDTRTFLTDLDPDYDNIKVGYGHSDYVGLDLDDFYLRWGDDHVNEFSGDGQEAVLVNFDRVKKDFPEITSLTVQLYAYWWRERYSGNLKLQFGTYKGGRMIYLPDDKDFINEGGRVVQSVTVNRNSPTRHSGVIDGDYMGRLVYNYATKTAQIYDADGNPG